MMYWTIRELLHSSDMSLSYRYEESCFADWTPRWIGYCYVVKGKVDKLYVIA
jgi:hypothetical protein